MCDYKLSLNANSFYVSKNVRGTSILSDLLHPWNIQSFHQSPSQFIIILISQNARLDSAVRRSRPFGILVSRIERDHVSSSASSRGLLTMSLSFHSEVMKRRPKTNSSRPSASRTTAARASSARAYAARARTKATPVAEEADSSLTSRRSSPSSSKVSRGRQKQASEKSNSSNASPRRRTNSRSAASSAVSSRKQPATSSGKPRSNVRVLPRGVHPKELGSGVGSTPKRMKVSVPNSGTSPASTLTTLSLKSSSSTSVSSTARSSKSSTARSTGASTTFRKLDMDDKGKNQTLNIFVAKLYSDDHLFELYCNKANPTEEEKDDFLNASFPNKLHDVLAYHKPSENKSAYVKLCAELGVYCDTDKVKTESKIKAAIKELVVPYYEEIK